MGLKNKGLVERVKHQIAKENRRSLFLKNSLKYKVDNSEKYEDIFRSFQTPTNRNLQRFMVDQ